MPIGVWVRWDQTRDLLERRLKPVDFWWHEEPQEVIFLHGIWRHIKEFGIEGQIPRISSPVELEKRC